MPILRMSKKTGKTNIVTLNDCLQDLSVFHDSPREMILKAFKKTGVAETIFSVYENVCEECLGAGRVEDGADDVFGNTMAFMNICYSCDGQGRIKGVDSHAIRA